MFPLTRVKQPPHDPDPRAAFLEWDFVSRVNTDWPTDNPNDGDGLLQSWRDVTSASSVCQVGYFPGFPKKGKAMSLHQVS